MQLTDILKRLMWAVLSATGIFWWLSENENGLILIMTVIVLLLWEIVDEIRRGYKSR